MPLFDRKVPPPGEVVSGSDAGTRALSVAAVENAFVEGVYDKLATVHDLIFGPTLPPGRLQAIQRMNIQPGERVLERLIFPYTIHIGFKANLDLPAFLAQASLEPVSIEKVDIPRLWSLVTCVKD